MSKWIGIALIAGLLIVLLREYVLIIVAILLLLFLIRLFADIFWWGRDGGKW